MPTTRVLSLGLLVVLSVGAGCSGDEQSDGSADAPAGNTGAQTVSIDGNAYEPDDLSVAVGGEVEWSNDDSATHTVRADDGTTFDSDDLAQGETFRHQFDEPGEFAYTCEIHPFMHATITVE